MASKRPVRISKDLSTMTVTPGTRAADGTYSWVTGSAVSVLGHLRGFNMGFDATTKEISSDADPLETDWNISDAVRGSLDVYEINDGTDPQPLLTLVGPGGYDWFKISRTIGSGMTAKTLTTIHSRGTYTVQHQGKDEPICTLNLGSSGSTPSYS